MAVEQRRVGHTQVRRRVRDRRQGGRIAGRRADLIAMMLEDAPLQPPNVQIIVEHQRANGHTTPPLTVRGAATIVAPDGAAVGALDE